MVDDDTVEVLTVQHWQSQSSKAPAMTCTVEVDYRVGDSLTWTFLQEHV